MEEKNICENIYESPVEELLKRKEDEFFDRTEGGQDNMGITIASLGTKNGGVLVVGQKDLNKGGEITGIEDDFNREFAQAISNVKPAPLTKSKIIEYQGKKIAVIEIKDVGELRPCAYKKTFYERKSDSNISLQPDEVRRYHITYGGVNIENLPTHASIEEIDKEELEKYSKLLVKDEETILNAITSNDYLTIRGVVALS